MAKDCIRLVTEYTAVCTGPDGRTDWAERGANTLMTVGLTHAMGCVFNAVAQITQWFMGLIANSDFDEITVDDTMSGHAGWVEFEDYSGATRPQWTPLSVSGGVIVNTSAVQFTFNAASTVKGFFIASSSTKGGTTGTIWCAAQLSTARTIRAGANLTITYTVRAAGGT